MKKDHDERHKCIALSGKSGCPGDHLLVEFASAVQAVDFAVDIQGKSVEYEN